MIYQENPLRDMSEVEEELMNCIHKGSGCAACSISDCEERVVPEDNKPERKGHYYTMHCNCCHHEWQSTEGNPEPCDWCIDGVGTPIN